MVEPMNPTALAAVLERQVDVVYAPEQVAAVGARGGWAESAARLHAVLEAAVAEPRR